MTEPPRTASQSYYHGCDAGDPDTASVVITLSNAPEGHTFPPSVTLPGECIMCRVQPVVLRAVTPEELAELGVELDDLDDEGGDCW